MSNEKKPIEKKEHLFIGDLRSDYVTGGNTTKDAEIPLVCSNIYMVQGNR